MNEESNGDDILEVMKKDLENRRNRQGYDLDIPFEPIKNKNTFGRQILSIGLVTILVIIVIIAIAVVALQNAGAPLDII